MPWRITALLVPLLIANSTFGQSGFQQLLPETLFPQLAPLIDQGLLSSESMELRELAEQQADGARIASRSAVLPKARISGNYQYERSVDSSVEDPNNHRLYGDVTISQPLYHWGARKAEKEIGEIQYDMERLSTLSAQESYVNRVRAGYMELIVLRQELLLAEDTLRQRRRQVAELDRQFGEGTLSQSEFSQAERDLSRREIAYERTKLDWDDQFAAFCRLTGVDSVQVQRSLVSQIPQVKALSSSEIKGFASYFESGLLSDEQARRDSLSTAIDEKLYQIEKQSLRPKLDVEVGYSQNGMDSDGVLSEREYFFAGLAVRWNIFDGFRTKGRRMELQAKMERNARTKEQLESLLLRSYRSSLSALEFASRSLALDEMDYEDSQTRLAEAKAAAEEGRMSSSEFETTERQFRLAHIGIQRSRIAYLNALSAMGMTIGLDPRASSFEELSE